MGFFIGKFQSNLYLMSLPTQSVAYAQTTANIAAFTATANTNFINSSIILIDNAIPLGFFGIAPFIIPYLSISTVTTYFQSFGYTVSVPHCPNWPFCWDNWAPSWSNRGHCGCTNPCRLFISWSSTTSGEFLLLEDGFLLELEDGSGDFLLE